MDGILGRIQDQGRNIQSQLSGSHYWDETPSNNEIRNMLEDTQDKVVMEGLRRLMASMSQGGQVVELFPSVVKLVARTNPEVKKIVSLFLVQHAEFEPQLSLLGINLLKKDLTSPNQLLRADALRTLSSLRVKMILPLLTAAVVTASKDSSAFVRKASAHAIPKLFSMDPSNKEALVELIDRLLSDRSTLVVGSAAAAFNEVCPDQYELVHPHFRRLCEMCVDVDEWGQIEIVQLLTRYARTQFVDPDLPPPKKSREGEEGEGEGPEEEEEESKEYEWQGAGLVSVDTDHRFLLDSMAPLLHSQNPAVILGVVSL